MIEAKKSVEREIIDILKEKKMKISVAESFTGGSVSARIVSESGASAVFYEGIVAYDSLAKQRRLGVSKESVETYKPVSEQVAEEMVCGLLKSGVDVAISTTGIAGPKSDDSRFPVGLCYIGVGTKKEICVEKYTFDGNRAEVILKGTNAALENALNAIKKL